MNRLTYLPRGYCEIGFANEVVLIEEAVQQAIIATLLRMTARRLP
ncbi:hypothetical protein [Magnetospirillum sp. ME-1]|nr:hypothetical protein [Magnetospirillum sp. ME-1]